MPFPGTKRCVTGFATATARSVRHPPHSCDGDPKSSYRTALAVAERPALGFD